MIHDLKVYGYNIFLQKKLDKLGRIDKYITEKMLLSGKKNKELHLKILAIIPARKGSKRLK